MCLLGPWADAREVAYPILWPASDEASCATGSDLWWTAAISRSDTMAGAPKLST